MISLSQTNYFTGEVGSVSAAVSRIVRFLEIEGINPIFLTPAVSQLASNAKTIGKSCAIVPRVEFAGIADFDHKLADRGLMFRCNLIVADLWHLDRTGVGNYRKMLAETGIKHIIMAREYRYSESEDVSDFHIVVKYESLGAGQGISPGSMQLGFKSETTITEKRHNWKSTLEELKKSYIRDRRIDGILGEEDC